MQRFFRLLIFLIRLICIRFCGLCLMFDVVCCMLFFEYRTVLHSVLSIVLDLWLKFKKKIIMFFWYRTIDGAIRAIFREPLKILLNFYFEIESVFFSSPQTTT